MDDYESRSIIRALLKRWDLRPRVHRIDYVIGVAAGALAVVGTALRIPSGLPFALDRVGFGSTRPYDHRICQVEEAGTDQVKWISLPVLIEAFMGNQNQGGDLYGMRGAIIEPNEAFTIPIRRVVAVDPLELYPGAAVPSVAHLALIGWDLLVKGKGGANVLTE
jgi:hypothetical protein